MTSNDLKARFASKNLRRGAVLILSTADALSLIDAAAEERLPILGVDGFFLYPDGGTQPDMGESVNFSSGADLVLGAWAEARAFITARSKYVDGFEVVVGD